MTTPLCYPYRQYGTTTFRPVMPITVLGGSRFDYRVLVDSGADSCIFSSEVAVAAGIDYRHGERMHFTGVTSSQPVTGYRQSVLLGVGSLTFSAKVIFADIFHGSGYGIVGQRGFFDRFTVSFDYPAKTFSLRRKAWV